MEVQVKDRTPFVHPAMAGTSLDSSRSWTVEVSLADKSVLFLTDVSNSPQLVLVSGRFFRSSNSPFGYFDTPADGATGVTGNIPVSGWALDDIEVTGVEIWRDPVGTEPNSLHFIGDAVFMEGKRPDVEQLWPGWPFNYRAGWGYMMLTNMLPWPG